MQNRGRTTNRSAESGKSRRKRSTSGGSNRRNRYSKLSQSDVGAGGVEMGAVNDGMSQMQTEADFLGNIGEQVSVPIGKSGKQQLRPHEIYEGVEYIPNTVLRLLEVPMNSSLTFQKLLWFHGTYDVIYGILMIYGMVYRLRVMELVDPTAFAFTAFMLFWVPLEILRMNFGYTGNINETFPELIAFVIFTFFFIIPLAIMPLSISSTMQHWPHERVCIFINIGFVLAEFVVSFFVLKRFMATQAASFYLRTAPLIDKNFQVRYGRPTEVQSEREIQLGVHQFDKQYDQTLQPFKDSDRQLHTLSYEKKRTE